MTTAFSKLIRTWFLPLLSGVFIGTSYIPFPPWASLFCFVPLWLFWQQQSSLKQVLLGGMVTSFVFTLIGFNWVTYLLHEFAHLDWPLAVIGMIVYGLVAHLFVPLAGALWFVLQRKLNCQGTLSVCLMAIITILCEANSLTLFDWNFGYTWYGSAIPVYQWAEFIGFSGLSALTLAANLPCYFAWQCRQQAKGKWLIFSVAVSFSLLNACGLWLEARLPEPDSVVRPLLVQASIENEEKLSAELGRGFNDVILQRYLQLTETGLKAHADQPPDFALWPETAFPGLLGEDFLEQDLAQQLLSFLTSRQLNLITGAYGVEEKSRLITNSLFIVNAQGELHPDFYSKTILLAFGEYIPGEQYFPQIRQWLPPTGHFARGAGPTKLFEWHGYKIGGQICYESLFPAFARSLADLGAQFIVNVTNDSWYGTWQEPYQHMYMTLARGVEFRRPVMRVTNTGISTISLASGEILERSPIHQPWQNLYEVKYLKNPPHTFYQDWFYLVPTLRWLTLAWLLIIAIKRNRMSVN